MISRAVELYYSITELTFLLRFSDSTIRQWIKAGRFSPPSEMSSGQPDFSNILDVQGDIRVPASGVQWFIQNNPLRRDPGTKARNKAELMRKLKAKGEPNDGE